MPTPNKLNMADFKYTWINFEPGKSTQVKLRFDVASAKPKQREGDNGPYTSYTIACEGGLAFSAGQKLFDMLKQYKAGDSVTITRNGTGFDTRWSVEGTKGNPVIDLVVVDKLNSMDEKLDHIISRLDGQAPSAVPKETPKKDNGVGF